MRHLSWIAWLLATSFGGMHPAMGQSVPVERAAATQAEADFARFGVLALLEGRQFRVSNRFVGDPSTRSSTAKFYWLDEAHTKLREIRILATTRGGTPAMVEMMSDWSLGSTPGELVEHGIMANGKSYTMTYRLSADGTIKATAPNPISKFVMEIAIDKAELAKRFSTRSGKYVGAFVYAEESGAFDQDAAIMPGYNERMARQRREELAEERRRGQALFDIYLRAITPRAPVVASPGVSSGVPGVGDMGGSSYRAAPRMTPEQQANADELERFKMREQARAGTGSASGSASAPARSRSKDPAPASGAAAKRQVRNLYVFCTAMRRANVMKANPDPAQRNRLVDRQVSILYLSQIGMIEDYENGEYYPNILTRWGRTFTTMLPSPTPSDWYVTSPGVGSCAQHASYDDAAAQSEKVRSEWMRQSKGARDTVSAEMILWTPQ